MHYVFFMLPLLATGARHAHRHVYGHHCSVDSSGAPVELIFITEYTTKTVTAELNPLTSTNTATRDVTIKMPSSTASATASTNFELLNSTAPGHFSVIDVIPNAASIINSCDYPVHVSSVGHPSCQGPAADNVRIDPKSTFTEAFRKCEDGGISLKVSKTQDPSKPIQFEYSVWKDNKSLVSYDISYLDCMKNGQGQQDLSECAGHDGGIQAVGGGDCNKYHCLAGKWCDKDAYVVAEFGYKPGAPVGACNVDKGIAFELCAEKR